MGIKITILWIIFGVSVAVWMVESRHKCNSYKSCKEEYEYNLYSTKGFLSNFNDWQTPHLRMNCYKQFGDGSDKC